MKKRQFIINGVTGRVDYQHKQEEDKLVVLKAPSYSHLVLQQNKVQSGVDSTKEITANVAGVIRKGRDGTEYYSMPSYTDLVLNSIK